jgi:hypothetical protein
MKMSFHFFTEKLNYFFTFTITLCFSHERKIVCKRSNHSAGTSRLNLDEIICWGA